MSSDERPTSAEHDLLLRAEGVIYSITVETEEDPLDWLDHVLLDLTEEPRQIEELVGAFPLQARFLDNAIARLLERNLLLLDVHEGSLRASRLERPPRGGNLDTLQIWQDHATGMIVPAEGVKPWAAGERQRDLASAAAPRPLRGGPPHRTPIEMSDAELLHRLLRFRPDLAHVVVIRTRERVKRLPLEIRALRRADGRLGIKDEIPWPLRAAWARLPEVAAGGGDADFRGSLPSSWEQLVGKWLQESHDRLAGSASVEGAAERLLQAVQAEPAAEMASNGAIASRRLAREARSSLVLAVSAGYGTAGEAAQVLQESSVRQRTILLSGLEAKPEKREEWDRQGVTTFQTPARQGPDCLLVDGGTLALGGINPSASRILTIRTRTELTGYVSWLAGLDVSVARNEVAEPELARELRALENDLRDWSTGHEHRAAPEEEVDEGSRRSIQEHFKERCAQVYTRLLARPVSPITWLSPAEALALVEDWVGPLRVLVRDPASPLARAAVARGVDCLLWPKGNAPADCVVADRVVLLGFSHEETIFSGPDFLAIHNAELAIQIRMETYNFVQLSVAAED